MKLGALVGAEIITKHGDVDFCPLRQIGGFVEPEATISNASLERMHAENHSAFREG